MAWLAALGVFGVLAGITLLIWSALAEHRHDLQRRHLEDVCGQAARRIEVFVSTHLREARIFAHRWAMHENRDYSRRRFEEFSKVLLAEIPGFLSLGMLQADDGRGWDVPIGGQVTRTASRQEYRPVLLQARRTGEAALSPPYLGTSGDARFFAVLALTRDAQPLGSLLIEFAAQTLMDDCFQNRIRSEFHFRVRDGQQVLFSSAPGLSDSEFATGSPRCQLGLQVAKRAWELSMVPRRAGAEAEGRASDLAALLLGFGLSLGMALLTWMLLRRMQLFRAARDSALRELVERQRVEVARQASETRYQSVFDSATDGLLVLEPGGTVLEANPAAGHMHGRSPEQMRGLPVQDLIAPTWRWKFDVFRQQLEQLGRARLDSVDQRADGQTLDVEVRGTRFSQDGQECLLAILTDVSDRRRALERQAALSRKVIRAQEEERARLSRELHDELGQILTALRLELGWLEKRVGEKASGELGSELANAVALVDSATEELRRICRGLRPQLLDDLGLEPVIRQLLQEFQASADLEVELDMQLGEPETRVAPEGALCAYRILQEALTNVRRHARASRVKVQVESTESGLRVVVEDDGSGFEPESIRVGRGCGLEGMRERANLVRGKLTIESGTAAGCRVELVIPHGVSAQEVADDPDPGDR
jgi:PAS domain S-box-containing protein